MKKYIVFLWSLFLINISCNNQSNSKLSEKNLLDNGYKKKKIFQVEALRYRFKKTKKNKKIRKPNQ